MARRLQLMDQAKYRDGFAVRTHPECLAQPSAWRKGRMVFVCSMSDLFHREVPERFISHVFDAMETTPQHTYQVLTKRPERMWEILSRRWDNRAPPAHIWCGTTIENQRRADERMEWISETPCAVRFVSVEPLIERLNIPLSNSLDWVICGSEAGPGARPMEMDWVRDIRDQCVASSVPFFFKQKLDGRKKISMPELDGRVWAQMPAAPCGQQGSLAI